MMRAMHSLRLALFTCSLLAGLQALTPLAGPPARQAPAQRAAKSKPSAGRTPSAVVREVPFGLSIEYPLLERALGPGPCPGRALIATIRALGSPSLRIGGDSQDLAGPSAGYHYFIP